MRGKPKQPVIKVLSKSSYIYTNTTSAIL